MKCLEEKAKNRHFSDSWLNKKECDINMWILKGSTSTSFRWKVCRGSKIKTWGKQVSKYGILSVA